MYFTYFYCKRTELQEMKTKFTEFSCYETELICFAEKSENL
jgi:hypothetical protein